MIGIDTNVLVRLFELEDDPQQTAAARRLIETRAPVFINPIVLAEFAWTLRSIFKLDREAVYARLLGIVDAPEFTVLFPQATGRAIEQYGKGPAGFADYLIGELNLECGCERTFTFDEDAARNLTFRAL
jgi:predicted nucleic-acid-binding protein